MARRLFSFTWRASRSSGLMVPGAEPSGRPPMAGVAGRKPQLPNPAGGRVCPVGPRARSARTGVGGARLAWLPPRMAANVDLEAAARICSAESGESLALGGDAAHRFRYRFVRWHRREIYAAGRAAPRRWFQAPPARTHTHVDAKGSRRDDVMLLYHSQSLTTRLRPPLEPRGYRLQR